MPDALRRCAWIGSELMREYHDQEWGVPLHDDRKLFEFLVLEGMQAGLSWSTVLNKRENFRRAFDGFDAETVARYDAKKIAALLRDTGIIRNRQKIAAAVKNAQAFLAVREEFGSFDAYQWWFVGDRPKLNRRRALRAIPPRTRDSDAFSRDLIRRGFRFVGSTIVYSHMQATGMVNDHLVTCHRWAEVQR
jgi:DNA-3-methyladenine glycosylase I